MALITCSECASEISDKASVCIRCGAPLAAEAILAEPVTAASEPKTKWWLWIPLALVAAFFLFGAMIPKNIADANAFRRTCEELVRKGIGSQPDCDRQYVEIKNRK